MHRSDVPIVKDLVLVGGGHAHVEVLRRFAMRPLSGVRLTVISKEVHTPYTGMLPGFVAGLYGFDDVHIDLGPLAARAGARLLCDEAIGLDLAAGQVLCKSRPPVAFDILSLDTGSTPDTAGTQGAAGRVVPVKPVTGFVSHWAALLDRVEKSEGSLPIGVVGGGAGGVEILLSIQSRLRAALSQKGSDPGRLSFHLFTADREVMIGHNARVRARFSAILQERGVQVHEEWPVDRVAEGRILSGERSFALDEILWVTNAAAPDWPGAAGLAVDGRGFVEVDETLRSLSHRHVFAVGDVATMADHPRPKAGVFAVRQGQPLARNLRRAVEGRSLGRFRPQRRFLSLISTGGRYAVASWGPLCLAGRWVWHWKDWIDRRFMARYGDLPEMAEEALPLPAHVRAALEGEPGSAASAMRCAGCGAKVGAELLAGTLGRLAPVDRSDVLVGLAEAEDAAIVQVPAGKQQVLSVDYFPAFIEDAYRFARIAATHALSDLYAMGAEPQSAMAVVTVPYAGERVRRRTLDELMAGAVAALNDADASLVGGHTGEGAGLALGFAVTGLVDAGKATLKKGLMPGDRLVITKPIGTGTLLAAQMRGEAKARWIEAALGSMEVSNRAASRVLRDHGARAVTDVTGFGLAGHLLEMLRAAGLQATLDLAAVPVLDGALATVGLGILSSLHPKNVAAAAIENGADYAADPRYALLFDPQTSGGLLAGIPADRAEACRAVLCELGPAAIIGQIEAAAGPAIRILG